MGFGCSPIENATRRILAFPRRTTAIIFPRDWVVHAEWVGLCVTFDVERERGDPQSPEPPLHTLIERERKKGKAKMPFLLSFLSILSIQVVFRDCEREHSRPAVL